MSAFSKIVGLVILGALALLAGCGQSPPSASPPAAVVIPEDWPTEVPIYEGGQLVTATVNADLVRPGRVLMSARGNHWIYDSVPPINGPNEAVNPLDATLGALISCGMFIYEAVAIENYISLDHVSAIATGELDPRGVAGAAVNPRIRAFHVTMNVEGPNAEEAQMMAAAFSERCPIHTTLARSAPIR